MLSWVRSRRLVANHHAAAFDAINPMLSSAADNG
jgi:hypothetical protein